TIEIVGHSILLSPSQPRPRLRRIERRADNRLRCISSGVEGVAPDRGSPEYATASMPPWRVGRIAHGRSPYAKRASFLSCRVLNPIIKMRLINFRFLSYEHRCFQVPCTWIRRYYSMTRSLAAKAAT